MLRPTARLAMRSVRASHVQLPMGPVHSGSCGLHRPKRLLGTKADDKGASASTSVEKPKPSIPDATTLFKMSNPELWLDPDKRSSWYVVGGVIAFFSVYLTVSAYREGLFDATASTTEPAPQVLDAEVHKVTPFAAMLTGTQTRARRHRPILCTRTLAACARFMIHERLTLRAARIEWRGRTSP